MPKETWFFKEQSQGYVTGQRERLSHHLWAFLCIPVQSIADPCWNSLTKFHPSFDGAGSSRAPWGPAVMTRFYSHCLLSLPSMCALTHIKQQVMQLFLCLGLFLIFFGGGSAKDRVVQLPFAFLILTKVFT